MGAGLRSIVGGETETYTPMLVESRNQVTDRFCENAVNLGVDAVVMIRSDSGSITGGMQSVVAYGITVRSIDQPRRLADTSLLYFLNPLGWKFFGI